MANGCPGPDRTTNPKTVRFNKMNEFDTRPRSAQPDRPVSRRGLIRTLTVTVFALPTVLAVGGCGQKGPLYLPETDSEEEEKKSSG